jgi:hypothetical protein
MADESRTNLIWWREMEKGLCYSLVLAMFGDQGERRGLGKKNESK